DSGRALLRLNSANRLQADLTRPSTVILDLRILDLAPRILQLQTAKPSGHVQTKFEAPIKLVCGLTSRPWRLGPRSERDSVLDGKCWPRMRQRFARNRSPLIRARSLALQNTTG